MFGYTTGREAPTFKVHELDAEVVSVEYLPSENDASNGNYGPDSIHIVRKNDNQYAISIILSAGSEGGEMRLLDSLFNTLWIVNADGSQGLHGGLGKFDHSPPASASLITGALSSVTDANAKAVITSIIVALTADGGAVSATT